MTVTFQALAARIKMAPNGAVIKIRNRLHQVFARDRMQFDRLKRRGFITLLSGAVVWPLAARAQQDVRQELAEGVGASTQP